MVNSFDQLKIDTPEQIALELPIAGIGSRFLAMAVDTLIQAALYLIVALIAILSFPLGSSVFTFLPKLVGPAMAIFVGFAVYWGYFAIFEIIWSGQTPGKRFTGIRVIKESGRPINAFEAVGRNLMRAVDGLPGIYGVGVVCMMCNQQSRRLGDFVAGTVVVHERPSEEVRPSWNTATETGPASSGLGQVAADDLIGDLNWIRRCACLRRSGLRRESRRRQAWSLRRSSTSMIFWKRPRAKSGIADGSKIAVVFQERRAHFVEDLSIAR
jgi:uncharacterized RDD family membrane protein YckC